MRSMSREPFSELLDTLYYGALDERDKGDKFERLMRSYLLTDRAYSFSNVWLWNEYPQKGNRVDTGVDLVGVRAALSACRGAQHERRVLPGLLPRDQAAVRRHQLFEGSVDDRLQRKCHAARDSGRGAPVHVGLSLGSGLNYRPLPGEDGLGIGNRQRSQRLGR